MKYNKNRNPSRQYNSFLDVPYESGVFYKAYHNLRGKHDWRIVRVNNINDEHVVVADGLDEKGAQRMMRSLAVRVMDS